MADITIEKLSIISLVFWFVAYIVMHVGIIIIDKKLGERIKTDDNPELKTQKKITQFLGKWFPAIYVVILLILFYVS